MEKYILFKDQIGKSSVTKYYYYTMLGEATRVLDSSITLSWRHKGQDECIASKVSMQMAMKITMSTM